MALLPALAPLALALVAPLAKFIGELAVALFAPFRIVVVQFTQLVVAPLVVVVVLVHAHVAAAALQLAAKAARLVGAVVGGKTPVAAAPAGAVALQLL